MKAAKLVVALLVLFPLFLPGTSFAATIPVDLNDFFPDPTVTVAADGQSAVMAEDDFFYAAYLANDPYFYGDPGLAVPTDVVSLDFHLNFIEPGANDDTFYALLFDGDTDAFIDDFYLETTWEGDVSFDLTGLDPATTLLGLVFQLDSWDLTTFDSTATISSLAFRTQDITEDNGPAPVPEPGTFLLISTGLAGLAFVRKKQNK